MSSVYVFIPKSKLTQTMINLSVNYDGGVEKLPVYKDSYIIETEHRLHDVFLPYPQYSAEEARVIVGSPSPTWWDWFSSLFGN
jgi:hypothetical protein